MNEHNNSVRNGLDLKAELQEEKLLFKNPEQTHNIYTKNKGGKQNSKQEGGVQYFNKGNVG